MSKSKLLLAGVGVAMLFTAFGLINVANANPLQFKPTVQTATATSSVAYMTAGTATSTLTIDSNAPGQPFVTDQMALLIQNVASSTSSILNIAIQYSQDGIDWYSDNGTVVATSTPFQIQVADTYTWTAAGTATTSKALFVRTPTRFVRAVFSVPAGAAAGGVWAQWVPSRQISQ